MCEYIIWNNISIRYFFNILLSSTIKYSYIDSEVFKANLSGTFYLSRIVSSWLGKNTQNAKEFVHDIKYINGNQHV